MLSNKPMLTTCSSNILGGMSFVNRSTSIYLTDVLQINGVILDSFSHNKISYINVLGSPT
jgi:hypothetical protein